MLLKIKPVLAICIITSLLSACNKDDDNPNSSAPFTPPAAPAADEILFSGQTNSNPYIDQLFKINVREGSETQLTYISNGQNDVYVAMPDWSPSGAQIAFTTNKDGKSFELYTMKADGSDLLRLKNDSLNDFSPKYSPNGDKLLYIERSNFGGNSQGTQLFTMDTNGENRTPIFFTGSDRLLAVYTDWSPDGQQIIVNLAEFAGLSVKYKIYTMNVDGSNMQLIPSPTTFNYDFGPSYSPNGEKVLFSSQVDSLGSTELFTINIDGSNLQQLTRFTNGNSYSYTGNASWHKSGTKIAFISTTAGGDNLGNYDIYTMNIDGSELERLTNNERRESGPTWK